MTTTTPSVRVKVSGARGASNYQLWQAEGHIGTANDYLAWAASLAIGATVYGNTADGLSGTADGAYFLVVGSNDVWATLYQNSSGAADEIASLPSNLFLQPDGTPRTIQYGLNAITFVTPLQKGGSSTIDSTQALVDALSEGRTNGIPIELNLPIRIDSAVEVAGDVHIRGTGMIDLSGGGTLKFGSGVTALPDLAVDVALFATTLTFASAHGLAIGDVVALWNPTDFSQAPNVTASNRSVYRAGDMFRVAEILSSTQIRFFGVAREAFAAADMKAYRLNGGRFRWEGVGLIPPASGIPLFLDGLTGVGLIRPRIMPGAAGASIEIHRCYGTEIVSPDITSLGTSDGYPIIVSNSQHGVINGMSEIYSGWHCVSFGGRDGDATVPTADWLVANVIASNKGNVGIGALETHGGCKRIVFDNFVTDVLNVAGSDMSYRAGTIYGRDPSAFADGNCIFGTEIVGGTFTFENLRGISAGDGANFASHLDLDLSMRSKPVRIVGRNLDFENIGASSATARVMRFNAGAAPAYIDGDSGNAVAPIDIHFDGLRYSAPANPVALVGFGSTQDISAVTSLQIDNYKGPLDNLLGATNSANLNVSYSGTLRKSPEGYASHGQSDATLSADRVLLAATFGAKTHVWDAAFGANRTVTLSTTRAKVGDTFRIVRTGGNTGGPWTLDVGGLTTLSQNEWCEVTWSGSAWVLSAKGSLT